MNSDQLPQILFLYGPAGCGKGTQAIKILERYPDYEYMEVGEILRKFVAQYKDNSTETAHQQVAISADSKMSSGQAVDFADWRYVWDHVITPQAKSGKKMLFDGIFREYHQSMFLANFVLDQQATCALAVIHITVEEAIKRLSTRYYVPGNRQPFASLEEARKAAPAGVEPTSRSDDQDPEVIRARYRNQYEFQFGRCISIYQRVTGGDLYIIDGEQSIDDVYVQIDQNLENFRAKFSRITI
jgi:adenylate kinase family enzyme